MKMKAASCRENEDKPLYNSRIVDTYIKLIKRRYPSVSVGELLRYAGIKAYEVADQGHWFSQRQINRFHEKLQALTENQNIAREAGRYAASPEATGVMRQYILGMVQPARAYEIIGRASANFTRSTEVTCTKLAPNKVEVTAIPNPGVDEMPFQCENRTGFLEAISMAFTNRIPSIEHPECVFRGDSHCRYIISWEIALSAVLHRIRNIGAVAFAGAILVGAAWLPPTISALLFAGGVSLISALTYIVQKRQFHELQTSLFNLRESTERLVDQMNVNYKNALMANEIGQAVSRQTNINDILRKVIQISVELLDYDRGLVLLADKGKNRLYFRAGFGYTDQQYILLKNTAFHLDKPDSRGVFVVSFREQKPFLINDFNEVEENLSQRSLRFAQNLGAQAFICCPIICDGESIGILAVDNLKSKRPLVQSDISLLMGVAPIIGVSIRNAELLEGKTRLFSAILHALAASIDARDPLTAGHSEKVTDYACGICEELGLSEDYREMIRVAALLHDYGKIGVPDAILKKPGKLTVDEYEIVKAHVIKTKEILERIAFEGIYRQVPEVAGAHHEKIDGSGYPDGLKGDQIPLGARIIAVADFFEAITAKRHYREPMAMDKAMTMLRSQGDRFFDRNVIEAFFRYLARKKRLVDISLDLDGKIIRDFDEIKVSGM